MTRESRKEVERYVMRQFASACQLQIDPNSIESREPPEPDIRCVLDGKYVAFELTEIIDNSAIERINLQLKTQEFIASFYRDLQGEKRENFDSLYGRCSLAFDFDPKAGLQKRKAIMRTVFDILLSVRPSIFEFSMSHDPGFDRVLRQVRVKKNAVNGPSFQVSGYGYLGDPTKTSILNKFKNTYRVDCELHLLAYASWDLLSDKDEVARSAAQACSMIDDSRFHKVWVFDCAHEQLIFESKISQ